ncbi:MAG TPA: hypothetical protein VGR90_04150, partial [Acidimicrobiales bacterium]|nr:hypothetical protein [Acidimicrobiales bacterium]
MAQRVLDPHVTPTARYLRNVDVLLIASTLIVAIIGVVMVYSATRTGLQLQGDDPHLYLKHQATYVVLGVVAMV